MDKFLEALNYAFQTGYKDGVNHELKRIGEEEFTEEDFKEIGMQEILDKACARAKKQFKNYIKEHE